MDIQPCLLCDFPLIRNSSKEYREFAELLKNIDILLDKTGAEKKIISFAMKRMNLDVKIKKGWIDRFRNNLPFAIRCNIVRRLLQIDYRGLSIQASDSLVIQWFLNRGTIEGFSEEISGCGLSKSALERYDKIISAEDIENVIRDVCKTVSVKEWTGKIPEFDEPLSIRDLWADCTCLESNIHFPVDWVLLRDAVRTLVGSIGVIRRHGLKYRIKTPEMFRRDINQLCMEMTAVSRQKESKKKRKKVLRKMIAVVKCVEAHAIRYRDLLVKHRESHTDLTQAEAAQVLLRLNEVITQLPVAINQVKERILRGKQVPDSEKILSLYEHNIHIIFRGKSGARIEFGNTLYLAENRDGLIVDFKLYKDRVADCVMVDGSVNRCKTFYGGLDSMTTDRGFHSTNNTALLEKEKIANYIMPKSPKLMAEAFKEPKFRAAHKRRAQTEGRIGIFKNVFIGQHLCGKGFEHQEIEVAWCVLVHNFWVLGRLIQVNHQNNKSKDKLKKSA